MKQTLLTLAIIALSIIGIADSSYLVYEKISGIIPPCGPGFDCGKVLSSPYSQIGPVPLSVFGVVYYVLVFLTALGYYVGFDFIKTLSKKVTLPKILHLDQKMLLAVLSSFGFAFSLYLVSLMAFVIQAWCLFCLVSAGTSTTVFVLAISLNYLPSSKS